MINGYNDYKLSSNSVHEHHVFNPKRESQTNTFDLCSAQLLNNKCNVCALQNAGNNVFYRKYSSVNGGLLT